MGQQQYLTGEALAHLQENPNAIPEGETPHAVSMFAFDSLLDVCKPGDRITVTGIYKAVPMRTSPRLRQLKVLVASHTGQRECCFCTVFNMKLQQPELQGALHHHEHRSPLPAPADRRNCSAVAHQCAALPTDNLFRCRRCTRRT